MLQENEKDRERHDQGLDHLYIQLKDASLCGE